MCLWCAGHVLVVQWQCVCGVGASPLRTTALAVTGDRLALNAVQRKQCIDPLPVHVPPELRLIDRAIEQTGLTLLYI